MQERLPAPESQPPCPHLSAGWKVVMQVAFPEDGQLVRPRRGGRAYRLSAGETPTMWFLVPLHARGGVTYRRSRSLRASTEQLRRNWEPTT
jgi:hypothetical protein